MGDECFSTTGELTQGELYSAIKKEKEQEAGDSSTTHFSGEMHFYELVEDTKDGIWLVQVKTITKCVQTSGNQIVSDHCECLIITRRSRIYSDDSLYPDLILITLLLICSFMEGQC